MEGIINDTDSEAQTPQEKQAEMRDTESEDADSPKDIRLTSVSPATLQKKGTKKRTGPYNPYELETKKMNKGSNSKMLESLKNNAVQVCVEFYGMTRMDLFGEARCYAVMFNQGTSQGSWQMVESSEYMKCMAHMRCFKKFRLRAGTEVDRDENMLIALFDAGRKETSSIENIDPADAWALAEFSVADLLESDQMILERRLKYGKSGALAKGSVSLVLDMIYHSEYQQKVTINFGFLDGSPRRNRMYFEISKALRRGKWAPLFKSEVRNHDDVAQFNIVTFEGQDFHGGDADKLFRLELYRWYRSGKSKLLGFVQTNFSKLISLKKNDQLYWWPAQDGITTAKVNIQEVVVDEEQCVFSLRMANMF